MLIPVTSNGILTEVRVLEEGSGYDTDDTRVLVETEISTELQPEFYSNLKTWRLNLFEKIFHFSLKMMVSLLMEIMNFNIHIFMHLEF